MKYIKYVASVYFLIIIVFIQRVLENLIQHIDFM